MKLAATITPAVLLLAAVALAAVASTPLFTTPTHLAAGHAATITVNNADVTWKTLIVMPGVDFTPTNGHCYTNLRISAGYLPRYVWACRDFTAPIQFTTPAAAPADLVDQSQSNALRPSEVGLLGTGGVSRGAWTLAAPIAMFDQQLASTL